jgi:hypothetical protein
VKQRVSLDDNVLAVVRMFNESVGLALREKETPYVVAYAESETVTGAGLEGHSWGAKDDCEEFWGTLRGRDVHKFSDGSWFLIGTAVDKTGWDAQPDGFSLARAARGRTHVT